MSSNYLNVLQEGHLDDVAAPDAPAGPGRPQGADLADLAPSEGTGQSAAAVACLPVLLASVMRSFLGSYSVAS